MSDKLDMKSPDLVNANFEKLAALFPNCVTEGPDGKAIDFDLLKQELSHAVVEGNKERYRLEWPGKREAIVTANLPTPKTLRPVREDSVDFDNTENIYIEGDNLEVLKLLQESYLGKIKMIYIDPPYNTGKDFVYKDNFAKGTQEELVDSGQKDEYNQRLVVNPETSGRYHSDWLSMMYPRLKLARNLLKDDGVIFISIDDNEVHNLRKICDDVFGENNFISGIVWKKKTGAGKSIKHVFDEHEHILMYSKSIENVGHWRIESDGDGNFKNPDNDSRGSWESCAFTAPSKNRNRNQLYMIEIHFNNDVSLLKENGLGRKTIHSFEYQNYCVLIKEALETDGVSLTEYDKNLKIARFVRRWAYSIDNVTNVFSDNRVYINGANVPRYKKFESEYDGKALRSIYYSDFSTQQGTEALSKLFGSSILEYPKSIELLGHITKAALLDSEIVLDFFSGSSSTAHALLQLNAADSGNRKYIMVQLPESTDQKSEAFKAGYKTICDIGKERIRRAAKKIQEETGADIDYGFRVYRLDESNMRDVYYKPQDYSQDNLDLFADNVKPDRTADDLLAQIMLDWGLPLSLKIEQVTISGKQVFKVAEDSLFACFDTEIDEAFAKEIAKEKPLRIVFRDSGFKNDTAKTNVKQLLKQLSPETEMKVI
jgi:adenine-specific DNA-methyltransferase